MSRTPPIGGRHVLVTLGLCAALAAGCGGSSPAASPASTAVTGESPPDLAKFLALPVATPSACPSNVSGSTVGRSSPWVGHVDVSVFVSTSATARQSARLGTTLRAEPIVQHVYLETARQAYEEFQRLYTCWASVPRSQTPGSYRLVLTPTATLSDRNALVQRLVNLSTVDSVSCDPTVPCTNIVRTSPTP